MAAYLNIRTFWTDKKVVLKKAGIYGIFAFFVAVFMNKMIFSKKSCQEQTGQKAVILQLSFLTFQKLTCFEPVTLKNLSFFKKKNSLIRLINGLFKGCCLLTEY